MSITKKEKLSSEWVYPAQKRKVLLRRLGKLYPNPQSELHFQNPYQLLCAVLLSAQCTDKKVNDVTPELFSCFPDFASLAKASHGDVARILRPVNYYKTKTRHLCLMANLVLEKFQGKIPQTHEELTTLPGVGRKTANVLLSELGLEPRIAVDTHVFRVARRLSLSQGTSPLHVEEDLMAQFHKKDWRRLHHYLILHGRRVCLARSPRCSDCSLQDICSFGISQSKQKL